ncbi:MAG: glycosyltransferase family 4 protein [Planctomycetota bacterium]|nr:glycosyltransferase family 4 protein [Planctomycetota bacterium]
MRVGFLIDRWQPSRGGAEACLGGLAGYLEEHGHRVEAIAHAGPREGEVAPGRLHLVPRPGGLRRLLPRGRREAMAGRELVEYARHLGCDVTLGIRHLPEVDLYWPHAGAHLAGLRGRMAAKASAVGPIVREAVPERVVPRGRHMHFAAFERRLCEQGTARRIVCVSDMVRDELAAAYPTCADRLVVIPNGVDRLRFRPWRSDRRSAAKRLGPAFEKEGGPLLAFVAREPILKGLPALVRALAGLLDRPWRLVVAGPRRYADVERYLLPFGEPEVIEAGPDASGAPREPVRSAARWVYLPDVDTAHLYQAATLTLQPTWRDACSLVTLESLACGRRVVTTMANGAARGVLDGGIAPSPRVPTVSDAGTVLFDAADEPKLAHAIADELDRDPNGSQGDDIEFAEWLSDRFADFDSDDTHAALMAELLALAERKRVLGAE